MSSTDYRIQSLVSSLNRVEQALRSNADAVAALTASIKDAGSEAAEVDLTSHVSRTLFSVFNTSNVVSAAESAILNARPSL